MLFARQGFHGTGMAEIARVSEVLVGQIYRDFAGKEDLIAAIVERDVTELLDDPEMTSAIEAGQVEQLNSWIHRFVSRSIDNEARNVLADILAEATRNPRIAAIVKDAHERLSTRLVAAAKLWIPEPERTPERQELADLILAAAGAIQHRHIFGLEVSASTTAKMLAFVDAEIDRLGPACKAPAP
jgi:AcrR family transcriptional regulator